MLKRLFFHSWWLISFALYIPFFLLPLPPRLARYGIEITDELMFIVCCAIIYFALRRGSWGYRMVGLSLTLFIYTFPLLRVWETAASGNNFILGLLPFLDAGGYYSDALRLVMGKLFVNEGVYRPFFSAFLGVLLKLMNGDLQIVVALLTVIYSLGVYSLAVETTETFGSAEAGLALIVFLQYFYRQIAGSTMTEQLGVPIGAFGLALLIRSIRKQNQWFYLGGLFLLSFALLIRAGAYFVLPALMLFGLFNFTPKKSALLVNCVFFLIAISLPWGMEGMLRHLVTPPGTVTSANFAFTLYGQARGGAGWRAIAIDHPELINMPKSEVGHVAYQYAFTELEHNPFGFVQGSIKALSNFFTPAYLFNVFQTQNSNLNLTLQTLCFIFFLVGFWFSWKKKSVPLYRLLLAGFVGILLSVPFLPPWDGGAWWGGIRVHSATLGFHLIITGVGLSKLMKLLWKHAPHVQAPNPLAENPFWILGFVVALATMVGPYFVKSTASTDHLENIACAQDEIPVHFLLSPGSFIIVENNDSGLDTFVPVVLIKHIDRSMSDFVYGDFAYIPRRINQRSVFTFTNDLLTGQSMWIVGPPELANVVNDPIAACGRRVEVPHNVIYLAEFK